MLSDVLRVLSYFDSDKILWMVDKSNMKYLELVPNPMDFVTMY
jgi:hypothetical protein